MITLYPSRILVENYQPIDQLEKSLSVWNKIYYRYDFRAFIYDEYEEMIVLPGGFNFNRLKILFPYEEIVDLRYKINSEYVLNKEIKLLYPPKNKLQEDAVNFLVGNRFTKRDTQKMLSLNTGDGKTYVAINYLTKSRRRPVIFVDQDSLCKQWKERIQFFTDTKENEIFIISGKDSIKKLQKMSEEEILNIKFFICIYRTISVMIKDGKDQEVIELFEKLQLGVKIFDEAHVEWSSIFLLDCYIDWESIYLTATPKRSDPIEDIIYQRMFNDVKRFTSFSSSDIHENYHNIIVYKINTKPSGMDQADMMTKYGFSSTRHASYLMEKKYEYFYSILFDVVFKTMLKNGKKKKKIAILLSLNDFVDKIYNDFIEEVKSNGWNYTIGKFNSTIDENKRREELDKDIIITTDKSFSKGIDVSELECLINTVPLGSVTLIEQIVGRLRRIPNKKVFFFDIVDIGFTNCKNQLYQKNKVYKKKAIDLIEVNV